MVKRGSLFIGTSGFAYSHWQGVFYPEKLPKKQWLEYYVQVFNTVEINSSFYHLPQPSTCDNWRKRAPDNFIFSMKASRFITHIKKLTSIDEPLQIFFKSIQPLKEKCGPILFQLPPAMNHHLSLLKLFIEKLPHKFRYAFEFRNSTWYNDDLYKLLESEGVAFCVHDLPSCPSPSVTTEDFTYIRFHGAQQAYSSCYSNEELELWAERIVKYVKRGVDVYAYFNNDISGNAVNNALTLKQLINNKITIYNS